MIRKTGKRIIVIFLCIAVFLWYLFPLYWTVATSFKPRIYVYDPSKLFFRPSLEGYKAALNTGLLHRMGISAIVAGITTISSLFWGSLAAYAIARFRFPLRMPLLNTFIIARYLPPISLVFPYYVMANLLGIFDTVWVLILAYHLLCVTFTVLMMSGFFKSVPRDLEEAAMIDGCGRLGAFIRITLPLVAGGLFATGVFVFLYTWNEFTYALFLTAFRARTWPTTLSRFIGIRGVEWGPMTATASMAMFPVLVLALIFRRYIVQGLTFGILEEGK